jgi:hypothetical protein
LRYALQGKIPDGYLVRISSLSAESEQAFVRHKDFADALMSGIDGELRQRLTGRS